MKTINVKLVRHVAKAVQSGNNDVLMESSREERLKEPQMASYIK